VDLEGKKLSSCEEDFVHLVSLTCTSEICGEIFVATFVKFGFHNKKNFFDRLLPIWFQKLPIK